MCNSDIFNYFVTVLCSEHQILLSFIKKICNYFSNFLPTSMLHNLLCVVENIEQLLLKLVKLKLISINPYLEQAIN